MPANSKEIKRRIKSVSNIGKITKAMELVSAAKMRKAQAAATASRPYSKLSSELLQNLVAKADLSHHPLINRVLPDELDYHFEAEGREIAPQAQGGISHSVRDGKN